MYLLNTNYTSVTQLRVYRYTFVGNVHCTINRSFDGPQTIRNQNTMMCTCVFIRINVDTFGFQAFDLENTNCFKR